MSQKSDHKFLTVLAIIALAYGISVLSMALANVFLVSVNPVSAWQTLQRAEIRQAILLSLGTSLLSTILSVWIGTGIAYLVSRFNFKGRQLIDWLIDLPIFLPPLVIGVSLLILFRCTPLAIIDNLLGITFEVPAIILAQTIIGVAFVYRTMKASFDTIAPRQENIAQSLGCSRLTAFYRVTLPQARAGLVTASAIAWARCFGEFGPVLVFAGSIRGRTEVMPISIYLELNSGNSSGAALIALVMIAIAGTVLVIARWLGDRHD